MTRRRRAPRPKLKAPPAQSLLTRRVRKLIDRAYGGNIRLASMTTGLPYATLRDLYTGRTLNPSIRTLQVLAARHGFSEQWFLRTDQGDELPMGGWVVHLPPPGRPDDLTPARESFIPHAAWPLVGVYRALGEYLESLPPAQSRPVLGDATDEAAMHLRLTRFLFGPLLAAEAQGEPPMHSDTWDNEQWLTTLQALGRLWERAIPNLLAKAHAYARQQGRGPTYWMGFNADRERPGGSLK